jgi:hypothetical protein
MPTGSQYRLDILWALIDGLIPGKSGLLAEGGHPLNQLIDLRIEEVLPIARLEIFNLIGSGTQVPILNPDGISRTVNRQAQVIGLARDHEVQGIDRRPKEQPV